jgi:hypothetical protein
VLAVEPGDRLILGRRSLPAFRHACADLSLSGQTTAATAVIVKNISTWAVESVSLRTMCAPSGPGGKKTTPRLELLFTSPRRPLDRRLVGVDRREEARPGKTDHSKNSAASRS